MDTSNNCKKISEEFDAEISRAIALDEPISIDALLEGPALLTHQLFEADEADQDVRR